MSADRRSLHVATRREPPNLLLDRSMEELMREGGVHICPLCRHLTSGNELCRERAAEVRASDAACEQWKERVARRSAWARKWGPRIEKAIWLSAAIAVEWYVIWQYRFWILDMFSLWFGGR